MSFFTTAAACFVLVCQLEDAAKDTHGKVLEVDAKTVTISVKVGQEPKLGTKCEFYVELPDQGGTAIIGTGRVKSIEEGRAVATIDTKTGRISKNHLVHFIPTKSREESSSAVPEKPKLGDDGIGPTNTLEPLLPREFESEDSHSDALPDGSRTKPSIGQPEGGVSLDGLNVPKLPASSPSRPSSSPSIDGEGETNTKPVLLDGDFAKAVQSIENSVVSVGDPEHQAWGTGFVISRKQRLVATNAHVADIAKSAVLNQSRVTYKVERIWYHPGVLRIMDDGKTVIQSNDPTDGSVDPESADVAILQLERVGPDLPNEVVLAAPLHAQSIIGSSIGVLGYPGYQGDQAFRPELFASATFVQGSVSRLTGLRHLPNAPPAQRQSVSYDARTYGGFSGSPVFLGNGQVVAIHNHSHHSGGSQDLASGIRVDVLWELLLKEKMLEMVSGDQDGLSQPESFILPADPHVEILRRASKLLDKSADVILHDEFEEAQNYLKEAKSIAPDYWRLYWQSSRNINHMMSDEWPHLEKEEKTRLLLTSLGELKKASSLYEQAMERANVRLVLDQARELVTLGRVENDKKYFEAALEILNNPKMREVAQGKEPGYLLALRGAIKTDLEDLPGALIDLNNAIELQPKNPDYYLSRAYVWKKMNQPAEAANDKKRSEELREAGHVHDHHD